MLKIGLTGGIGSGKTVVSDAFSSLGVPVIDTDIIARNVLKNNNHLLQQLTNTFGKSILNDKQQLVRSKLRDIAFKNETNKDLLDKIMHPSIRKQTVTEILTAEDNGYPYCIIVVPLLIETGFIKLVDRTLVVTAPRERKLQWLEARSQLNKTQAEKIMSSQSSDDEKLKIADDHILNDSDKLYIEKQVAQLHKKYSSLNMANLL